MVARQRTRWLWSLLFTDGPGIAVTISVLDAAVGRIVWRGRHDGGKDTRGIKFA